EGRDAGRGDGQGGRAVARDVGVVGAAPGVAVVERQRVTRRAGGDNRHVRARLGQNEGERGAVVREGCRGETLLEHLNGGAAAGARSLTRPCGTLRARPFGTLRVGKQPADPGTNAHGKSPPTEG